MSRRSRIPLLCVATLLPACVDDGPGTPAATAARYVESLSSGDVAVAYDLLRDDVRADFDALHAALRTSAALVRASWPVAEQPALIERLGAALAEQTPEPRDFFAAILGGDEQFRIGRSGLLGARPMSVDVSGDGAAVSTLAGDTLHLARAADGEWRVAPPDALAATIAEARRVAEANLEHLRAHRMRTRELERGVVRPAP